jgi:hypothetical protein
MAYQGLNNVATADAYATGTTVLCAHAERINLNVTNAALFYQFGHGIGAQQWDEEIFLAPGFYSFDPLPGQKTVADAVRVRSAKAGVPARVTVQAR